MYIYSVLHHFFYIKTPVSTYNMIPDAQVFKIEFIAQLEKSLTMNVVSVNSVDDKRITQIR